MSRRRDVHSERSARNLAKQHLLKKIKKDARHRQRRETIYEARVQKLLNTWTIDNIVYHQYQIRHVQAEQEELKHLYIMDVIQLLSLK